MSTQRTGQNSETNTRYYFRRPTIALNPEALARLLDAGANIGDIKVLNALMQEAGSRSDRHNLAKITREEIAVRVFGKPDAKNHVSTHIKRLQKWGAIRKIKKGIYQLNAALAWSSGPKACHMAQQGEDELYVLPFEMFL